MLSILGFLIILGPLVIVHEFGHYIFARIFGVKAEIFSIGFGPVLWKKQLGETELRVSAIPLGGFVKLLGEDRQQPLPPELVHRALGRQAPWKRFFIFSGGPLFNFLFAILIFMAILAIGEPQMASVVGRVVRNSPAAQAGFVSGDKVIAIDGKPVSKFEEVMTSILDHPGQAMDFEVVHPKTSQPTHVKVTPGKVDGFSVYGEAKDVGEIDGLMPTARSQQIGISNPQSVAAQAGFKNGDQVLEINGVPVKNWEDIESFYSGAAPGSAMRFKLLRGELTQEIQLTRPAGAETPRAAWGLDSTELFIEKVVPGSPAEKSGVRAGDRLLGVGPKNVESFFQLRDAVQNAGEKEGKVELRWEREGKLMSASITPTATNTRDPLLKKTTQYTVGIAPIVSLAEPPTVLDRTWNPPVLFWKASERMVVFTYRNFVSIGKMLTGDVSVATLGGPILIGKIAGESISRGLIAFLTTMAVLSVGLGVLNILPIPILDGGHILVMLLEKVRRRPFTLKQLEMIQMGGLSLILLLMVVVFKNDLTRLPIFN